MKALLLPLLLFSQTALAKQSLLLIGGGNRPTAVLSRFVSEAGSGRIVIVTWATQDPAGTFEGIVRDFSPFIDPSRLEEAQRAPLSRSGKERLLTQLQSASALFFSGGDQNRIMEVLADPDLADALRERYLAGIPFGGTSAGTAVMSPQMFTGQEDPTVIDPVALAPGLGLLPGTVLDTHFVVRQRENRLFSAVLRYPAALGIGIDEDTAVWVSDQTRAEVVGPSTVMTVRATGVGLGLSVGIFRNGDRFEIQP